MSDRIETGAGEVAADEDDLAQAGKQKAGLMGGAVRALGRRIEGLSRAIVDLGDSLRGRISRGEDRIDALEAEVGKLDLGPTPSLGAWMDRIQAAVAKLQAAETQHAGKAETEKAIAGLTSRTEGIPPLRRSVAAAETALANLDRSLRIALSRIGELEARVGVGRPADPAPSSPELEERRGRGSDIPGPLLCSGCRANEGEYHDEACPTIAKKRAPGRVPFLPLEDFLTPPPIARAIGRAVMAAAEKIPDRKASHATTEQDAARETGKAKLRDRLLGILDILGGEAFDRLNHAIVDAQRAGVIP